MNGLLDGLDLSSDPSFGQSIDSENIILSKNKNQGMVKAESEKVSTGRSQDGIRTPPLPRRKLIFGNNLTPEVAMSRASPGATPTKRLLERSPEFATEPSLKRRNSHSQPPGEAGNEVELIAGIQKLGNPKTPRKLRNVFDHLMKMGARSSSTPGRIRTRGRKDSFSPSVKDSFKQRRLSNMWSPKESSLNKPSVDVRSVNNSHHGDPTLTQESELEAGNDLTPTPLNMDTSKGRKDCVTKKKSP